MWILFRRFNLSFINIVHANHILMLTYHEINEILLQTNVSAFTVFGKVFFAESTYTYNSTLNYFILILKRCCKISYLG